MLLRYIIAMFLAGFPETVPVRTVNRRARAHAPSAQPNPQ